ncbi:putative tail-component [Nostoc phage YongM]|nr:putative tail-component [Nostoc phage YongM]
MILSKSGYLFNDFDTRQVLQNAVDETTAIAVDIVGSRTPVRTGNLLSRWDSEDFLDFGGISSSVFNDTHYAGFVELGTSRFSGRFYLARSLPEIEETFIESVIYNLGS